MEDNSKRRDFEEHENLLKNRFYSNIQIIKKFLPDIASEYENYIQKKKIHFIFGKNGIPNVIFENNEPFFKCDDPLFFCRMQVKNLLKSRPYFRKYKNGICKKGKFQDKFLSQIINKVDFEKNECPRAGERNYIPAVVILGIGLGYQITELLKKVTPVNLILVEPDKDIFYASLYCIDWGKILNYFSENKLGLKIIIGEDNISEGISDFFSRHGKFLASNLIYYVHYKSELIKKVQKDVYKKISDLTYAIGFVDDTFYGISHAFWSVVNRKAFVKRTSLRDAFKEYPVFIIASGPSLDNDLEFLRKYQDKAIIVACGTALDILYHAGIHPDFYANTERTPEIRQSLDIIPDNHFFDNIILLAADVCHPLTVSKFEKTALFGKADEPFYKTIIENFSEYKSIQYITSMNPLVGNIGVASSLFLGFRNLYLFGVDCGKVKKINNIHSSFSSLYNQHGCDDNGERFRTDFEVEGNFGDVCLSNSLFQFSVRKIEEVLDIFKNGTAEIKCINCSDGCKIANTIPVHSKDLRAKFETFDNIKKDEFINIFIKEKTSTINLSQKQLLGLFNQDQIKSLCNELISFIKNKRTTRIDYIKMMEDISEHLSYLQTTKEYFLNVNCIKNTLQHAFIVLTQALYLYSDEKMAIEVANQIRDVVIDYLTELPEVYLHLPYYIMGEEKASYPNGIVGRDLPNCNAIMFGETPVLCKRKFDDPQKKFVKKY